MPCRYPEGVALEREGQDSTGALRGQSGAQFSDPVGDQHHEDLVSG